MKEKHILLVAATPLETLPLRKLWDMQALDNQLFHTQIEEKQIHLLHTGIGMVNTAFSLGDYLAKNRPDRAIHIGIAGSLDRSLALGSVVEVTQDSFSEMGAEDGEKWLDLEAMGFTHFEVQGKSFYHSLSNPNPSPGNLPKVPGITVNTVHGRDESIAAVSAAWPNHIESMEGAAFFLAMLRAQVPFYAFRSISNYVLRRDKSQWKIRLAVDNLNTFISSSLLRDFRD